MKKISLVLLCGVILLGVCGCGNDKKAKDVNGNSISIKDFVGTWEIEGNNEITLSNNDTYKLNNFIISEMVSTDYCAGAGCPQNSLYYYNVDNKLYTSLGGINTDDGTIYLCVQLEDKNTLKQVSCDILKNVKFMSGTGISQPNSMEDFGITYKKKSSEINETLIDSSIFDLQEKKTNEIDNSNNKPNNNNNNSEKTNNNNTSKNNTNSNNEDNSPKVLKKYNIKSVEIVDKTVGGLGVNCRVETADVTDVSLVNEYGNKYIKIKYNATMTPIEYQKEEYKEQFPITYCEYIINVYGSDNKRYFNFNATTSKVNGLGTPSNVNHYFMYDYNDVYSSLSDDVYVKITAYNN